MKRSGSKPGIQRRRSSGILKLGRLHLRQDAPKPAKNAVFSLVTDVGTAGKSTNRPGDNVAASAKITRFSRLPDGTAMPTAAHATSEPIPLPSSHIHRTASEINLLLDQKDAALRERIMFQRIVSGMVNGQRDGHITVSIKASSSTTQKLAEQESAKSPGSTALQACALPAANDSAQRLLRSVTPKKAAVPHSPQSAQKSAEVEDYLIGSFDNGEKSESLRRSTPPSSDSEEFFSLDM